MDTLVTAVPPDVPLSLFERFVNPDLGALLRNLRLDLRFVRGEGTLLYDAAGRAYLDFVAGYGAVPFGHADPAIHKVLQQFAGGSEPGFVQPSALVAAGELAERLSAFAPAGLGRVCFSNSGAEAVEAALKAARAATGRTLVAAACKSFHGKTLGALSATAQPDFQAGFGAPAPGFAAVAYGEAAAMEAFFAEHGAEIAAVIVEPVQGEGGVNVPPEGYLRLLRKLCDRHGALLIFDEVQTGLGRTGTLFACEAAGVSPDILTLAKALGGGIVPIGACLLNDRAWSSRFALKHSSTFAGNSLACRVGLAVLDRLLRNDRAVLRNVRERGTQLQHGLAELARHYPSILEGERGRGLLRGLSFGVSCDSFPQAWGSMLGVMGEQDKLLPLVASYLLNVEGIRTAPTLNQSSVLRVEPPLTVTAQECDRFLAALDRTLEVVASGDSAALLGHLAGRTRQPLTPPRRQGFRRRKPLVGAKPDEARFAFLIHPLDYTNLFEFDESLRAFSEAELIGLSDSMTPHLEPFVHAAARVVSKAGARAHGEFISVPFSAQQFMAMGPSRSEAVVGRAVDLARERGAQIVGLGGFTSIVMRGGTAALDRGVPITTGNSYTVLAAVEALELACHQLGRRIEEGAVAVVGAGGSIGGTIAALMLEQASRLVLVGNPDNPAKTYTRIRRAVAGALPRVLASGSGPLAVALRAHPCCSGDPVLFAQRLLEENGRVVPLAWSVDLHSATAGCAVVVTATSSTDRLINPDMLAEGAIVLDVSRPANTSPRVIAERPDVLVIDGGVIEVPGRPDLGFNFGFPRGVGYACMAETMMLALDRRFEHTSIGAALKPATLDQLRAAAARHGFRLAGLRSFDRLLTGVDWQALRRANARGERLPDRSGRPEQVTERPAAAESLASTDRVNAIHHLLERHLNRGQAGWPALIDSSGSIDYRGLGDLVLAAGARLVAVGLRPGDRIAILAPDSIATVAVFLGALRQGVVTAFLDPTQDEGKLTPLLDAVRPQLILTADDAAPDRAEGAGYVVCGLADWLARPAPAATPAAELTAGAPAVCQLAFGANGTAKAVLHSHGDIINTNLNYARSVLGLRADDVTLGISRLHFGYGFLAVVCPLFVGGAAVLAPPAPNARCMFELIEARRPSVFFGVPTMYLLMLRKQTVEHDLSSLRLCVSAGEVLPDDVFDAWRARFGLEIVDSLGSTEAMSPYLSNRSGDVPIGCLGEVVPGFAVQLLDEQRAPVEEGEVGTLWIRGNTLAQGYANDPGASADAFVNDWFCTNDMCRRDARGRFHFVGRANDMLKVGGRWVSLTDIEAALRTHPDVTDAFVVPRYEIGLLVRPHAFIVTRPGAASTDALAEALKEHVRRSLSRHQRPHFIEFVNELPRRPGCRSVMPVHHGWLALAASAGLAQGASP